ncbi:hypothetical protein [Paenibacillus larvae]|uniref:hypothetical protein n=1 Tax=Paenibacillus larvae TaxID=1464 RepID=UPI0028917BC7|nr:hypothetical protein [Paenibacillus larvae]MDT2192220.1 hypothetical protein [Paenibacillus larvae]MDT2235475.1 hypothetical protein [Paenibacillus larvae]MDT2239516.1 hypothetical protein [Paenibacillus larvae]MDT2246161.1 hypothetical protein [Paenibacillus larvae]MDT2257081.1 hypothetical protein [Paenibacillus larvae]
MKETMALSATTIPKTKKKRNKKSIGFAKIHVTLLDIGGYTAHPGMDNLNLNRNVFGRR